jgi:hypothetical protein
MEKLLRGKMSQPHQQSIEILPMTIDLTLVVDFKSFEDTNKL